MSLKKCFTARHLAAWSVGIAVVQFIIFSVVFMATGKIEDAVFAAVVAAVFAAVFAVAVTFAVTFAASAAAFGTAAVSITASVSAFAVTSITALAVAFGVMSVALAAVATVAARQDGVKGSFGTLFYIALPLGIAGAVFAFAKTGSWWLGAIILFIDAVGKTIVARRAEREKPATAITTVT